MLLTQSIFSQSLSLDTSFNHTGLLPLQTENVSYGILNGGASAIQPDGKLVFVMYKGDTVFLLRFKTDGKQDSSFGSNGIVSKYEPGFAEATKVNIQASGKIVLMQYQFGDTNTHRLSLFLPNGKTDSSFGINGKVQLTYLPSVSYISTIQSQPDGKILLAGSKKNDAGDWGGFYIIRLNINGSPDASFGNNGAVFTQFNYVPSVPNDGQFYNGGSTISELAFEPNGRIVAAGTTIISWNGYIVADSMVVVRYNTNGTLDQSFGNSGKFVYDVPGSQSPSASGTEAHSVCLQPDGKILISGGWYSNQTHGQWQNAQDIVIRLLPSGVLDNSFNNDGVALLTANGVYSVNLKTFIQSDGKILVAGNYAGSGPFSGAFPFMYVKRLTKDGSLENNFGLNFPLSQNQRTNEAFNFLAHGQRIYPVGEIYTNDINTGKGVFAFGNDAAINNPVDLGICSSASATNIVCDMKGSTYQWQFSTDSIHFTNLANNSIFSGVNTAVLSISNLSSSLNGYQFQCSTSASVSNITAIHILDQNDFEFIGSINNLWEEPGNWLCGVVPGVNANVTVKKGNFIAINSNVIINTLTLEPGSYLSIQQGKKLTITN